MTHRTLLSAKKKKNGLPWTVGHDSCITMPNSYKCRNFYLKNKIQDWVCYATLLKGTKYSMGHFTILASFICEQ